MLIYINNIIIVYIEVDVIPIHLNEQLNINYIYYKMFIE